MNLVNSAKTANYCQRNWIGDLISTRDLETIIESSRSMPSKQNVNYYSIVVSQNQEFNKFCYKNAVHKNSTKKINRNSQVLAPTLFLWIKNNDCDSSQKEYNEADQDIAIGISSGVAAYVSNLLGYRTGFCRCINEEPICIKLKKDFSITTNRVMLMLGVGKPNLLYNHNEIVENNVVVRTVETIKKNSKYYII